MLICTDWSQWESSTYALQHKKREQEMGQAAFIVKRIGQELLKRGQQFVQNVEKNSAVDLAVVSSCMTLTYAWILEPYT
jgi:hypothetical protein